MDMTEARFRASGRCNRLVGACAQVDDHLTFRPAASTKTACPPPPDALERQHGKVLSAIGELRLERDRLALRDDPSAVPSDLRAKYLR